MTVLSFPEIQDLWIANGGNPNSAPVMAAIATAESGGNTTAHNPRPPDDSYGLWQINYYGSLAPSRTARYGAPADLVRDPNAQAKAAIDISGNGTNLTPWSTYTNGMFKQFLSQNQIPALPTLGATSAPAVMAPTGGENEGKITMPSILPNIPRSGVRKVVGAAVLVGGALTAGAGLFLLAKRPIPFPNPVEPVQGLLTARREGRHEEARVTMAARQRAREADQGQRQAKRDQVGERRRARQTRAAQETRSAREAGERDAEAAGAF